MPKKSVFFSVMEK